MSDEPINPREEIEPPAPTTEEILAEVRTWIRRFVFCTEEQALAAAMWSLHDHAFDFAYVTPYVHITSPTPDCGKSTLAEAMHAISRNGEYMYDPTGPLIFRLVHEDAAAVFIDEADGTFSNEERRTVGQMLNAGYRKGGTVPRLDPPQFNTITRYSVFSPKVIVGLDSGMTPTLASRCLKIVMKPATRAELDRLDPFIPQDVGADAQALRARLARWAEAVRLPSLPDTEEKDIPSRKREILRPLLCIAEDMSEEIEDEIRHALLSIVRGKRGRQSEMKNVGLLRSCKEIHDAAWKIGSTDTDITSVTLLSHLVALPEEEYAEMWGWEDMVTGNVRPKRASLMAMARMLAQFDIHPHYISDAVTGRRLRGYRWADFRDAWNRHLEAPEEPSPPGSGAGGRAGCATPVVEPDSADPEVAQEAAPHNLGNGRIPLNQAARTTSTTSDPESRDGGLFGESEESILARLAQEADGA